MKKILTISFLLIICIAAGAQHFSNSLVSRADKGDADAMAELALCYASGTGVQKDIAKAVELWEKAAEEDNLKAINYLSILYYEGGEYGKDLARAAQWLERAAILGDTRSTLLLANQYFCGYGIPEDKGRAIMWYKTAAAQGSADAMNSIASFLENGTGIARDTRKAQIMKQACSEAEAGSTDKAITLLHKAFPDIDEEIYTAVSSSDVDMNIPVTDKDGSSVFAVIIANENYDNESDVDYAGSDGQSFARYCEKTLGLPRDNIRLVKDATYGAIRGSVNWLKNVADAYGGDASIIFYYAGHGVPDEKSREAYLLPSDGYGSDLSTACKMRDLYAKLSSCPSRHTIVFLDACFSGTQRSGNDMSSARAVGIATRKTAPAGNMVVFSAAQGNETAYPYREKKHGLFTYYLLKKLQLSRGSVTLGELSRYVTDNVRRKSVVKNSKPQTPSVQSSPSLHDRWSDIAL